MGGWLDHKELMLVKGIGKTPGDTYSAENDPVVANLMAGAITLDPSGWTPEIASVKNGGVWADSPINDGRQLLAASVGNVTEKIVVNISDSSYLGTMKAFSALQQMALDCRDYWQSEYQVEPVYLRWWAGCGVGPQYALLYNIEVSPEYLDAPSPTMRVTLSLEREPYWRGIPPGANPKIWAYYVNRSRPQYNVNGAGLMTGTDHLITQTIYNKHEWTPAAYARQITPLTQNYIDIPGTSIPGDAPALVTVAIDSTPSVVKPITVYIARSSKKYSGVGHDGVSRASALVLNAGDGNSNGVVTKTSVASDLGVRSNNSSVNYYQGVRTVTGVDGSFVTACQWGAPLTANSVQIDSEMFRGTFAIFCRAYNDSASSPALSDMRMNVLIEEIRNGSSFVFNSLTLPDVQVPLLPVNKDFELSYMGTVTLPFAGRSVVSGLGYGRELQQDTSNLRISLQQKVDVATANRTFKVIDLIFMPIDEGMANIIVNPVLGSEQNKVVLDNSGYLTRGEIKQTAFSYYTAFGSSSIASGGNNQECRGQDINLLPKVNQRLYILTNSFISSLASRTLSYPTTVMLNIVPRWAGIRDV